MSESSLDVTQLLSDLEQSKQEVIPRLFELLYGELRRLAQHHLQSESPDHTLQATALVHEAYIRLVMDRRTWRNRAQFFAVASSAMRRVLVDHARAKHAAKRPGSQQKVDLDIVPMLADGSIEEILDIDRALTSLNQIDPRQVRIVELRYFGGMTAEEAAEALGLSTITVQREWAVAKAWLYGNLSSNVPRP